MENVTPAVNLCKHTLIVALIVLAVQPVLAHAQSDPFSQSKPAGGNPFADVTPSDANRSIADQSEEQVVSEIEATTPDQRSQEEATLAVPESASRAPASPVDKQDVSQSIDWLGLLIDNLYIALGAVALLGILGWMVAKPSKKPKLQPRIKKGAFKKTNRFSESSDRIKTSNPESDPSQDTGGDEVDSSDSADIFAFEDELSDNDAEAISDISSASENADVNSDSEDEDDFLDLMLDDTDQAEDLERVDNTEDMAELSIGASDGETAPSTPIEPIDEDDDFLDLMMDGEVESNIDVPDETNAAQVPTESNDEPTAATAIDPIEDDDDFLELMMDDPEESEAEKLLNITEKPDHDLLEESHGEAAQAETSDDELFDLMFEDDVALDQVEDVEAPDELFDAADVSPSLEEDSDEFAFDLEPNDAAASEIAQPDKGDTERELIQHSEASIDDLVTPLGVSTFGDDGDVLSSGTDKEGVDNIESEDDSSVVAGGVAAAAGALTGIGALFSAKNSSNTDEKTDRDESEELRAQLVMAIETQQQYAATIKTQEAKIESLTSKLENTETEKNEAHHCRVVDLEEKLNAAEKSAAEFEAKLVAAESNIDTLEEQKQAIATELENKPDDTKEIERLNKEILTLKSQVEDASSERDQLQAEAQTLRKQVSELIEHKKHETSESNSSAASLMPADLAQRDVVDNDASEQLQSKLDAEVALRKRTEAMLIEAEQQRTDVAIALRDLRKQTQAVVAPVGMSDSDGFSEEIEALKAELEQRDCTNEALEKQADSFRNKLGQEHSIAKELNEKLAMSQERVANLTVLEDQMKQKVTSLEQVVEEKSEQNQQLTHDLQTATESLDELEARVGELQANDYDQKMTINKHEASLVESKSNLEAVIAEKTRAEAALNDLKEKAGTLSYRQLEEALSSVATLTGERKDLFAKLEQTRTNGEAAARENAQLTERIAQLEKQRDANKDIALQLENARAQLTAEKDRATEIDKANNTLSIQIDSLKQDLESLNRQRLSLQENLESRDKKAADDEAASRKETTELTQKIMTLKQLLANTEQSDNLKQQLEEERKQLRQVREQNTILSERVAGLEHQLKNRQAEAEKIDSLQQQWISQKELVSAAKEENAALKERTKQLDEQVKILNERSEKFALTTAELNQEKTRVSELTQRNAADQQRIKILEDQIAQGKQVAMRLDQTESELAHAARERVVMEQKHESLQQQLTQAEAVAEKNQRLNQQLGFMQRDLEAAEKKNRAIEQSRELESSPQEIGAIAGEKLERILGQLESQNRQISELVQENKNMALELASRKPTKRSKTTVIPDGHDDLTKIVGIGPMSQKKLYELGVKTHSQIAGWSEEDITKYSQQLGYKNNRIEQENWVAQAKNFHDTGTKRTS